MATSIDTQSSQGISAKDGEVSVNPMKLEECQRAKAVDVLVKNGNHLQLIEVKAKSFDTENGGSFYGRNGNLLKSWRPYLEDVAFQEYVLRNAFPEYEISPYLMLTDKSALCPTDGLNGKFRG